MEQADSCRRAAAEAIADIEPPELHDRIETLLEDASMVPGVLTLESAAATAADGRAVLETDDNTRAQHDAGDLATQAAGVQLIYEGLRLTRSLAHEEPWTGSGDRDSDRGDLEILAADILVARGFYLLARTDAAGKAVRTVQAFGRDQTRRDEVADETASGVAGTDGDAAVDPTSIDANLEHDILELAVLTGAAAVSDTPSQRLLATADEIADRVGTAFPPAAECLDNCRSLRSDQSLEDHTTDRATSVTDP
ncbi:hypothetical protein RBH26_09575 [Natronolimnohabitans sp. A-GB9]|uniref:DUF7114 family protein n=1 Tax=Natronolimnohabitans sp. A-GB9 TaxID=3069757 RepID=UPI0027B57369|nr:hypothetical protein [Natronolimnohabitans sp. A-GB9]MDQ2050736.1 hypothetical protein [Natronolimnohabitans sp. A-GB9]